MSLFEIEIPEDFKILNCEVFLSMKKFTNIYKKNNFNDDFSTSLTENFIFNVHHNLFVMHEYTYETEEIVNVVKSKLYTINEDSNEEKFYPEWILFLIAILKKEVSFISEKDFLEYLDFFKHIAEIRYKKYIIRNVKNFICHTHYNEISSIQDTLHNEFIEYINQIDFTTEELYKYLNFLYSFHVKLKDNEKYKLMWNLETYILETVRLLLDNNIPIKDIYLEMHKGLRGTYSVLHDIHRYKPLYIEESKHLFQSHLSKINNVFNTNITIEEFMDILTSNEKFEDTLFSYIELIKRFNANKMSADVMSAMIKGIVLGVEEHIKDFIQEPKRPFDKHLEKLCKDSDLFQQIRLRIKDDDKNILLSNLNIECLLQDKPLESYLAIYYNARNYLAHNNIDMTKFFWGNEGNRVIISNVIDSIMIILYKLEIINRQTTNSEEIM